MTKGHQSKVNASATVDKTTVYITGETIHSNKQAHGCAELVAEVLAALEYTGEYKVTASMQRLKGSPALQGLSTKGVSINAVQFGYQPDGNNSRGTYTLQFSNAEEAQKCFVVLKAFLGTAYQGKEVVKQTAIAAEPLIVESLPVVAVTALGTSPVEKPAERPKVYYSSDTEWMETFVLHLLELADTVPDKQVAKDQVFDLIIAHTHFRNRFGIGPIFNTLKGRGYLLAVDENPDAFTVSGTPKPIGKRRRKKASDEVDAKKSCRFIDDAQWVDECMAGIQKLVDLQSGLVSQADISEFIKQKLKRKQDFSAIGSILSGLKVRGFLITAGKKLYRVVYEPKPGTATAVVAKITLDKAAQAALFNSFAKYRMPVFAEGMFKGDTRILDGFLSHVQAGINKAPALKDELYKLYPVSGWSHIQLLNYMVGQGYLIRSGRNYALGPKGEERLGHVPRVPPVVPPAPVLSEAEAQSVTLEATPLVAQAAVPPTELSNVTIGLATALKKAKEYKAQADAREAECIILEDRLADVQEILSRQPDVEEEVQKRIFAMINDL